ncbi:MAG: rod shape-determining protein [Clostridiales bacterium]|nr:rod shape-determining protein [Clostridiales bacterium]
MNNNPEDKKIVFALDIGTRSVIGVLGYWQDHEFRVIDFEQAFHMRRAMRDGQIEDIDLVATVVNNVKTALEERSGLKFDKVSIAAAGRALKTAEASFTTDLIENEAINENLLQYMEYSAIESAQSSFEKSNAAPELAIKDYYCVGYSVKSYLLDNYKIKNLLGQKGHQATVEIIAAFLPSSVLVSLYAVTAKCNLDVENLTLEPIAAIHAVVPEDIRFLNIALVDIGGGTSDIALSKDGSIIAYDMVTTAGDEITETLMKKYLTNFNSAEDMKFAMTNMEDIEIKDILGIKTTITAEEIYETSKPAIEALADAISQRILLINGSAPAAVFLVGGGSQIRGLSAFIAEKLGMPESRVALGLVNTDNGITLFSDKLLSPTYVTPIGIGIVSALYKGCDFFSVKVNDKKIMLFNHQKIKALDALVLAGIKPTSLVGISAPNLVFTINGNRRVIKGSPSIPGKIEVNGKPANIETLVSQGDEIKVKTAKNGDTPAVSILQLLDDTPLSDVVYVEINGKPLLPISEDALGQCFVSFMDDIIINIKEKQDTATANENLEESDVTITKLYGSDVNTDLNKAETNETSLAANEEHLATDEKPNDADIEATTSINVILNGNPVHLSKPSDDEDPFIIMQLLKFVDLDTEKRGKLIMTVNNVDAGYSTPIQDGDSATIIWQTDDNV